MSIARYYFSFRLVQVPKHTTNNAKTDKNMLTSCEKHNRMKFDSLGRFHEKYDSANFSTSFTFNKLTIIISLKEANRIRILVPRSNTR